MEKYLKTPEEVIKALKEGKEIKTDGYHYKMIDGVICHFCDGGWVVGSSIDEDECPYIEEVEPLEFKVGKFYKSRKGEKWLCGFIGSEELCYPIKLVSQINGNEMLVTFEGRYNRTSNISQNDIVGEWEE
jgi:hypothetical protein